MQLSKRTLSLGLSYIAALVIALMPFHAFLTVWASSLVGHYTALRLWKECLLVILVVGAVVLSWQRLKELRSSTIGLAISFFLGLQVITGLIAYGTGSVSAKALGYGWVSDTRFLLFFAAVWLLATQIDWLQRYWRPLILIPAAFVVMFALLQYTVLPAGFMRHFGYGPSTISVSETIDHKQQYVRVASTLRGANPLGAYLVLIISILAVLALRATRSERLRYSLVGVLTLMALGFTFSRGAWLGTLLSLGVLVWINIRRQKTRRIFMAALGGFVVIAIIVTLALRHNPTFENTVFHTDSHSASSTSSNAGHVAALKSGLKDLLHEPFGRGPGTAGPASVYNTGHDGRIAENYFVQVGQETGWLGLVLFVFIIVEIGRALYKRRAETLALATFVSLFGLILVNLLSHAWADDTLAYVWWGLAAIAISTPLSKLATKATKG